MSIPQPGQKKIPITDWRRFLRVADWYDRTIGHGQGALRPSYGEAMIVKTPEEGIDGRDGDTLYSATCIKCVAAETATPGEKTLHETDEELTVYNHDVTDIDGDTYVKTNLSPNGTRYVLIVHPEVRHHWGKLDGDLVAGGTQTISIYAGGPTTSDLTDTGNDVTAGAPPLLSSGQLDSGDWVLIERIGGYWWVVGAPC